MASMYGQGNYAPQFRQGPPAQPPPFQQGRPPPPPPPFQQVPPHPSPHQLPPHPTPPPPSYYAPPSQQPVRPAPPPPMNMGQPYMHPPPPVHASASIGPPYPQTGPSYPLPMQAQNAHHVPQQMPPPPRVLPPPLQGQISYRIPPPPPPGIQHVPAPPPPQPASFVAISPASFASFGQIPAGEAQPPSLPPPPPPPPPSSPPPHPSPPPPLPPSPPPTMSPSSDLKQSTVDKVGSLPEDEDAHHQSSPLHSFYVPMQDVSPNGVVGVVEKNIDVLNAESLDLKKKASLMVEGESSRDLSSPPPKPEDEEIVKNIEVTCQFIVKVGPAFEEEARMREVGNPHFSFLFGGKPGSTAAIGQAYFQWMKKKYQFKLERHENLEHSALHVNLENDGAAFSPADSDMDMEDDVSHLDGGQGSGVLNKDSTGGDIHDVKELLYTTPSMTRQFKPEVGVHGTLSCSGSSKLVKDEKDDDGSSFMDDLSPVQVSPAVGSVDVNVQASIRPFPGNSRLVKVSPAAAGCNAEEVSSVFVGDRSPFRLIQGYASDDSTEDDKGDDTGHVTPIRASTIVAVGSSVVHQDQSSNLHSKSSPKKSFDNEVGSKIQTGLGEPSQPLMPTEVECSSGSPPRNATSTAVISLCPVDSIKADVDLGCHQQHNENRDSKIVHIEPSQESDIMEGDRQAGKSHQPEDAKEGSSTLAVDEFGRLVRKGASDSESEGMDHGERCSKRGRSWSRSLSPQENRERRRSRSPRRREKRSRSRSWSRKRSRSRSPPAFRRTSEFARWDWDQPAECFNFIRGRCFRGASCRFLHRDFGRHRGRQQEHHEDLCDSRSYNVRNDASCSGKSYQDKVAFAKIDVEERQSVVQDAKSPIKYGSLDSKVLSDSLVDETQSSAKNEAGLQVNDKSFNEVTAEMKEARQIEKIQEASEACHIEEERTQSSSFHSPPPASWPDHPALSTKAQSLPHEVSQPTSDRNTSAGFQNFVQTTETITFPKQSPATQAHHSQGHGHLLPNYVPSGQAPVQSLVPKEFPPPSFSAPAAHYQPSQVPPPAPEGSSSISHQSHPPPLDMTSFHQPRISRDFHSYSVPPSNPTWSNQPPLPPSQISGPHSRPAFYIEEKPSLQMQQSALPPRNDFNSQLSMGPYKSGELTCPQAVDIHSQPSSSVDSSHHSSIHMDEFRQRHMPVGNWHDRPFGRDERFAYPPMPGVRQFMPESHREQHLYRQSFPHEEARNPLPGQGYTSLSSFQQGSMMHPQPLPGPKETLSNQPPSVPGFHPSQRLSSRDELPLPPIRDVPYRHNQGPFVQQGLSSGTVSSNSGAGIFDRAGQRFSSSFPENNLPHHMLDVGVTKVATHYNPFASTFEQPPPSLLSGPSAGGTGSRITSPPSSRRSMEQFLPKEGSVLPVTQSGLSAVHAYTRETSAEMPTSVHKQTVREPAASDPYDPLFDSIEPSSNVFKKLDASQEPPVNDTATISKVSNLPTLSDVEESSKQKFVASTALKYESDEVGGVAMEAEVGVVENVSPQPGDGKDWSPDVPFDMGNTATGEIEIDQVQSAGRSKKSKDSRSMKLFKIALADFVKEVLKPSWRQGNMSKEAFKTIVKKTVDKVSGAMSSHQIPKTQAKINQYVESSQRKLTKLVMGYVDKYVKM